MKEGVLTVSPTDRSPAPLHPQMRIVLVEVRANLTGFRSARRLEEHSSGCVWVVWRCGLEGPSLSFLALSPCSASSTINQTALPHHTLPHDAPA